jgi:hypothetical protein
MLISYDILEINFTYYNQPTPLPSTHTLYQVLFLNATLCLEGFKFESEKKKSYKRERQVIVGLKFRTPDAPPPPNSLTPYLWNLFIIYRRS